MGWLDEAVFVLHVGFPVCGSWYFVCRDGFCQFSNDRLPGLEGGWLTWVFRE